MERFVRAHHIQTQRDTVRLAKRRQHLGWRKTLLVPSVDPIICRGGVDVGRACAPLGYAFGLDALFLGGQTEGPARWSSSEPVTAEHAQTGDVHPRETMVEQTPGIRTKVWRGFRIGRVGKSKRAATERPTCTESVTVPPTAARRQRCGPTRNGKRLIFREPRAWTDDVYGQAPV